MPSVSCIQTIGMAESAYALTSPMRRSQRPSVPRRLSQMRMRTLSGHPRSRNLTQGVGSMHIAQ
jgi:hypothetical protein